MSAKSKKSSSGNAIDSPNSPLAGLYLLFAELLHRELNPQLIELLTQPEILDVFTKLDPACADYLGKKWSANDYEQAAVDFCDLFILPDSDATSEPGGAPRAAAWLETGGNLTAESVDTVVNQFIKEWKIEVPPSYQHLAYDHLSLMFYLTVVIAEQDQALADEFQEAVLFPWVGKFGESLTKASSPLYRALGVMLMSLKEVD